MEKPLKVFFAATEASPLVKVGGLGDVAGSLPPSLRNRGHDVRIIMPRYRDICLGEAATRGRGAFSLKVLGTEMTYGLSELLLENGTPVYLVENEHYFHRDSVYGEPDDLARFFAFSQAVLKAPEVLGWQPDIFHANDWHTGLVPALLKEKRGDPFYAGSASVFTIHNLAYQGWFDEWFAQTSGAARFLPPPDDPQRGRCHSMAGLGIYYADAISTVSHVYAREILTPEYGFGFETLLLERRDRLLGIRNGVDYRKFDPAGDRAIAMTFDDQHLDRKAANKLALQAKAGLAADAGTPLLGWAARLVEQKGLDILLPAIDSLMRERDVQLVMQGTGEPRYETALKDMANRYPSRVRAFITNDTEQVRQIFAASDLFLAPSRFEPCGLAHLQAMRYGAVPVARNTGGLAETVPDCTKDLSGGLGFIFNDYHPDAFRDALARALEAFKEKAAWCRLVARCMEADFSWNDSLPDYEALYRTAQASRK
ncbi:MAG: glycogen synthase [Dehalococcoidia bacterium]|jgi:starch synthase|nr:MAG: glycogen synthase [Dehalococcoidia bacterium]